MARKREQTLNLVLLLSDTMPNASEFTIASKYRDEGALGIGSHYLITEVGEVIRTRPHDEHGNVQEDFNKNSIFIEVIGTIDTYATNDSQQAAAEGLLSWLGETYLEAEELDWTNVQRPRL